MSLEWTYASLPRYAAWIFSAPRGQLNLGPQLQRYAFDMSEQMNHLREYYERQDTEELLELSARGLTEEAQVVLAQVLKSRGVAPAAVEKVQERVPQRHAHERQLNKLLGEPSARLVAFLIDTVGCSILAFVLFFPLRSISEEAHQFAVVLAWWLYMLFRAAPTGQGFGKKVLNLRVVGVETGQKCSWFQSFWRNLTHFFFIVDAVFLLSNRRMRLGDMIASTVVVKSSPPSQNA
ncbi:RDD family protein [Roseateles sp. SL47]|uniref:RDD family protein n=1 Tax=Roseateles sp. SL47 TaxID=2995138 RepID=UPI00226F9BC9|nr:RDD family protein [Roseateles sp. SL47]WAC75729.1 RDD family protein [Roseateles sp. SL47]